MGDERYVGGYSQLIVQEMGRRSLNREGRFFRDRLHPGMAVLDCGCGPGTMTVEIAELVRPGRVTGIDIGGEQLAVGREIAKELGLANLRLIEGSVYELPFCDGELDAVFAHALLYHVKEPERALREMYRVLKPGGVIGIRDLDHGGDLYQPESPELSAAWALIERIFTHNGGNVRFGRTQGKLLRQAGFSDIEMTASYDIFADTAERDSWASYWIDFLGRRYRELALAQGWTTAEEIDRLCDAFRAWNGDQDGFFARCRCECVGRR